MHISTILPYFTSIYALIDIKVICTCGLLWQMQWWSWWQMSLHGYHFIFIGDNSEEQLLGNFSGVLVSIIASTLCSVIPISIYVLIHTYWVSLFFTPSTSICLTCWDFFFLILTIVMVWIISQNYSYLTFKPVAITSKWSDNWVILFFY